MFGSWKDTPEDGTVISGLTFLKLEFHCATVCVCVYSNADNDFAGWRADCVQPVVIWPAVHGGLNVWLCVCHFLFKSSDGTVCCSTQEHVFHSNLLAPIQLIHKDYEPFTKAATQGSLRQCVWNARSIFNADVSEFNQDSLNISPTVLEAIGSWVLFTLLGRVAQTHTSGLNVLWEDWEHTPAKLLSICEIRWVRPYSSRRQDFLLHLSAFQHSSLPRVLYNTSLLEKSIFSLNKNVFFVC